MKILTDKQYDKIIAGAEIYERKVEMPLLYMAMPDGYVFLTLNNLYTAFAIVPEEKLSLIQLPADENPRIVAANIWSVISNPDKLETQSIGEPKVIKDEKVYEVKGESGVLRGYINRRLFNLFPKSQKIHYKGNPYYFLIYKEDQLIGGVCMIWSRR